ncbi:hypothetical protein PFFCH_05271 [Plasmodium falciparum FCH/4]|uniref:ARID domain-containing protein n=1 Tax=Plasmodium falciparum FCH/4 TaxID=1036724 RepID=A0A024VGM7_PLAFA|nr:hypothetical protein PFFCH_05271 [Plasmodium falciparum FCH/4]
MEKDEFYEKYKEYYGDDISDIPLMVPGRNIGLHDLYLSVLKHGGYSCVSRNAKWLKIAKEFNLINKEKNIKIIETKSIKEYYLNYLREFERIHDNLKKGKIVTKRYRNCKSNNNIEVKDKKKKGTTNKKKKEKGNENLNGTVENNICGALSNNLDGALTNNLNGALTNNLNGALTNNLNGSLTNNLNGALTNNLSGTVANNLYGSFPNHVGNNFTNNLSVCLPNNMIKTQELINNNTCPNNFYNNVNDGTYRRNALALNMDTIHNMNNMNICRNENNNEIPINSDYNIYNNIYNNIHNSECSNVHNSIQNNIHNNIYNSIPNNMDNCINNNVQNNIYNNNNNNNNSNYYYYYLTNMVYNGKTLENNNNNNMNDNIIPYSANMTYMNNLPYMTNPSIYTYKEYINNNIYTNKEWENNNIYVNKTYMNNNNNNNNNNNSSSSVSSSRYNVRYGEYCPYLYNNKLSPLAPSNFARMNIKDSLNNDMSKYFKQTYMGMMNNGNGNGYGNVLYDNTYMNYYNNMYMGYNNYYNNKYMGYNNNMVRDNLKTNKINDYKKVIRKLKENKCIDIYRILLSIHRRKEKVADFIFCLNLFYSISMMKDIISLKQINIIICLLIVTLEDILKIFYHNFNFKKRSLNIMIESFSEYLLDNEEVQILEFFQKLNNENVVSDKDNYILSRFNKMIDERIKDVLKQKKRKNIYQQEIIKDFIIDNEKPLDENGKNSVDIIKSLSHEEINIMDIFRLYSFYDYYRKYKKRKVKKIKNKDTSRNRKGSNNMISNKMKKIHILSEDDNKRNINVDKRKGHNMDNNKNIASQSCECNSNGYSSLNSSDIEHLFSKKKKKRCSFNIYKDKKEKKEYLAQKSCFEFVYLILYILNNLFLIDEYNLYFSNIKIYYKKDKYQKMKNINNNKSSCNMVKNDNIIKNKEQIQKDNNKKKNENITNDTIMCNKRKIFKHNEKVDDDYYYYYNRDGNIKRSNYCFNNCIDTTYSNNNIFLRKRDCEKNNIIVDDDISCIYVSDHLVSSSSCSSSSINSMYSYKKAKGSNKKINRGITRSYAKILNDKKTKNVENIECARNVGNDNKENNNFFSKEGRISNTRDVIKNEEKHSKKHFNILQKKRGHMNIYCEQNNNIMGKKKKQKYNIVNDKFYSNYDDSSAFVDWFNSGTFIKDSISTIGDTKMDVHKLNYIPINNYKINKNNNINEGVPSYYLEYNLDKLYGKYWKKGGKKNYTFSLLEYEKISNDPRGIYIDHKRKEKNDKGVNNGFTNCRRNFTYPLINGTFDDISIKCYGKKNITEVYNTCDNIKKKQNINYLMNKTFVNDTNENVYSSFFNTTNFNTPNNDTTNYDNIGYNYIVTNYNTPHVCNNNTVWNQNGDYSELCTIEKHLNNTNLRCEMNGINYIDDVNNMNYVDDVNDMGYMNNVNNINSMNSMNNINSINSMNNMNTMNSMNSMHNMNSMNSMYNMNSMNSMNSLNNVNNMINMYDMNNNLYVLNNYYDDMNYYNIPMNSYNECYKNETFFPMCHNNNCYYNNLDNINDKTNDEILNDEIILNNNYSTGDNLFCHNCCDGMSNKASSIEWDHKNNIIKNKKEGIDFTDENVLKDNNKNCETNNKEECRKFYRDLKNEMYEDMKKIFHRNKIKKNQYKLMHYLDISKFISIFEIILLKNLENILYYEKVVENIYMNMFICIDILNNEFDKNISLKYVFFPICFFGYEKKLKVVVHMNEKNKVFVKSKYLTRESTKLDTSKIKNERRHKKVSDDKNEYLICMEEKHSSHDKDTNRLCTSTNKTKDLLLKDDVFKENEKNDQNHNNSNNNIDTSVKDKNKDNKLFTRKKYDYTINEHNNKIYNCENAKELNKNKICRKKINGNEYKDMMKTLFLKIFKKNNDKYNIYKRIDYKYLKKNYHYNMNVGHKFCKEKYKYKKSIILYLHEITKKTLLKVYKRVNICLNIATLSLNILAHILYLIPKKMFMASFIPSILNKIINVKCLYTYLNVPLCILNYNGFLFLETMMKFIIQMVVNKTIPLHSYMFSYLRLCTVPLYIYLYFDIPLSHTLILTSLSSLYHLITYDPHFLATGMLRKRQPSKNSFKFNKKGYENTYGKKKTQNNKRGKVCNNITDMGTFKRKGAKRNYRINKLSMERKELLDNTFLITIILFLKKSIYFKSIFNCGNINEKEELIADSKKVKMILKKWNLSNLKEENEKEKPEQKNEDNQFINEKDKLYFSNIENKVFYLHDNLLLYALDNLTISNNAKDRKMCENIKKQYINKNVASNDLLCDFFNSGNSKIQKLSIYCHSIVSILLFLSSHPMLWECISSHIPLITQMAFIPTDIRCSLWIILKEYHFRSLSKKKKKKKKGTNYYFNSKLVKVEKIK